jgi:UDP-glucose 4-epimerase
VDKDGKTVEESGYGKLSVFNLGTGIGYSVLDMIEGMKVRRPDTSVVLKSFDEKLS